MPVAGSGAGGGGKKGGRGPVLTIPVAPPPVRGGSAPAPVSTSTSSSGTKPLGAGKTGTSAGTKSASSSSSSTADYYKQQRAEQRRRDMATRNRYIGDAEQMQGQIDALRTALGPKGEFKDALKKRLRNIERVFGEQMADLDKAEAARNASLDLDASNNEIAAGDSTTRNDANRIRERTSALSELASQGGGESDALRAQMMSLRSGESNQSEIDRSFHDSQRSINASRLDLALDTHNARVNMLTEANADKEQLWGDFYNQTSETQTQLGNALGQQAEYYGLAHEAAVNAGGGGKGKKGKKGGGKTTTTSSSSSSSSSTTKGGKAAGRTPLGRRPVASTFGEIKGAPGVTASGLANTAGRGGRGGSGPRVRVGNRGDYGKGLLGDQDYASAQSDKAFAAAAQAQGRVWRNPGLTKDLENWEAPVGEVKQLGTSLLQNARTVQAMKAPEGATLRKW